MVEVVGDPLDSVYCSYKLVLFLPCNVQYPKGVPAPFPFHYVPHPFDGVQLAALRRKELVVEESIVELLLYQGAVVDAEVVHHNDSFLEGMDGLELLNEREEGVDCVGAHENLCKH